MKDSEKSAEPEAGRRNNHRALQKNRDRRKSTRLSESELLAIATLDDSEKQPDTRFDNQGLYYKEFLLALASYSSVSGETSSLPAVLPSLNLLLYYQVCKQFWGGTNEQKGQGHSSSASIRCGIPPGSLSAT